MKHQGLLINEFFDTLLTPVGLLYLIFNSDFLTGISFQRPANLHVKSAENMELVKKELTEYFDKKRRVFTFRTAFYKGTDFEKKVWCALKDVPYGETRTYKWMAERVERSRAFRAVGSALGKNPIPIVFPCHRIIEADGSIGGYSPSVDIKRRLLDIEYYVLGKSECHRTTVPFVIELRIDNTEQ